MLAGDEVLPVGHPVGVVEQAEILLGHLAGFTAVGVHHPDIVGPAGIGGEAELLAIRAEAWLHFPGDPGADGLGLAAGDGHGIDIPEQVKGDGLAIGTDVEVHPCAFVDGEVGLFPVPLPGRVVDIPVFFLVFFLGEGEGGEEDQCEKEGMAHGRLI